LSRDSISLSWTLYDLGTCVLVLKVTVLVMVMLLALTVSAPLLNSDAFSVYVDKLGN